MGAHSEIGSVRRIVLKHPREAFVSDLSIARQWRGLGYVGRPDFRGAVEEYETLVDLLEGFGAEVLFLPRDDDTGLDSVYVRDAAIATDDGLILCSMGKDGRRAEPGALERAAGEWGLPIRGAIRGGGILEGGDVVWIDDRALAVGRGYRTNEEGIRQLREILGDSIDELIVVPLPHYRGPSDVFHLMSVLSPIDRDLALVYSPLLPVPFREWLLRRGTWLVETPEAEFDTLGCNVLALAPRRCVALAGNPVTRQRLEAKGVEVHPLRGEEICRKGLGGPTCLTRPLERG